MAEAFQINSLEDEGHQDVVFKVEDIKEEEDSRYEEEVETGVAEAEEVDGSQSFLISNFAHRSRPVCEGEEISVKKLHFGMSLTLLRILIRNR